MKKVRHNRFLYYLIPITVSVIITTIGYFFMNGIPLFGVPKIEDVSYVEISNTRLDTNARKLTEIEDIKKAINLTNFLSYKLGAPEKKEALIKFVFHLKDGSSFVISSNEKTVYSNGKAYSLKANKGTTFIKVTEGIFFFDDLVEKEKAKQVF
ncbi:hypothetical protein [Clostridium formicaceticum]|uniref:Uncharacterized protein n=1 Tax=Clostridium formicaceticum TaxID=1497 RepID=A0AAC9WFZ5_9CLOT|nr:hypothetical protein [Clostridium formicaceticum]AOY76803.1 hypothetical protein BJL90_13640 [Clostridium formicaceticum]ARE87271.1 hypothetical protein CLFO_16700 [Clostridium formicaceticum]